MEQTALSYKVEERTAIFQGKPITLISRTPVFTPEQREKQRRFIESRLYDVVKKYGNTADAVQAIGATRKAPNISPFVK